MTDEKKIAKENRLSDTELEGVSGGGGGIKPHGIGIVEAMEGYVYVEDGKCPICGNPLSYLTYFDNGDENEKRDIYTCGPCAKTFVRYWKSNKWRKWN